ncbi:MAG: hypothetical protein ACRD4Y_01655, partial [Candidatus Acidiferrales bacterium]
MRLLNVSQAYYPFLDKGGPTVKVRALARGMASLGHSVSVLTADFGLDEAQRKALDPVANRWGYVAKEDGVEAIYLRSKARYRSLIWNSGVPDFCRERLAGYDIAHIFGLYDFLGPR